MSITDKLTAGIRMDAPPATPPLSHESVRALAEKTKFHPCSCKCPDCARFNKEMNNKDAPVPSVSQKLERSFKSLVHDAGARVKPAGATVKVPDEAGATKPKKKSPVHPKLAASLDNILKR